MNIEMNMNHPHLESIMQVQSGVQNNCYDYGTSFSNVITPLGETQVLLEQDVSDAEQNCAKVIQRNSKRPSPTERLYYCNECGASFSNSSNLKSHGRIHSGERPYVCDICGASFVQSSNMKAHKRIHTGERPYSCTECGQTFSRSSHLAGHKRTHTGERPYICGVCHESFVTSTHLRNHMRKHTGERPFVCKTCESGFAQNGALQIHLRIHTGERPFKCSNCTSAFRSKGDLRSHHKTHTESRPYSCSQCDKTFKIKQYLQKHKKKCGAPPTGKKRGRPKKLIGSTGENVLPKNSTTHESLNCSKGKKSRTRVKSSSMSKLLKFDETPPEINAIDIHLEPVKNDISDHSSQTSLTVNVKEQHSPFINIAKTDSAYSNHAGTIPHFNSFSCSNELTQTLAFQSETTIPTPIFYVYQYN